MTVATVTHGGQPVVAYQQLWQLAEQCLWLQPVTTNLHITLRTEVVSLHSRREGGFSLKSQVKNDYVL